MTPAPKNPFPDAAATLNAMELTSVRALVAYVAHNQKLGESAVHEMVAAQFRVEDTNRLPRAAYDDVIRFLVDLKKDLILN